MDKEMLQKVLDFIREGATAASGPAKWGFEQVCAYRASVALWELVALGLGAMVAFGVAACLIPSVKKGLKTSGASFWYEVAAPPVTTVSLVVGALMLALLLSSLPGGLATIYNPAGSVLNSLARGR